MNSDNIEPGDELRDEEGKLVYTVISKSTQPPHVRAVVKYIDGGHGVRIFEAGKETPLIRPN